MRRETENVRRKTVKAQNETRENIMLTYNDQTKARFPLSLDGRGARGEGGLLTAIVAVVAALLFTPQAVQAQCAPTPTGTEAAPAPAAGTITCQPGDYADGIYYDSIGDLTLEVPDDSIHFTVNDDGVNVTGNGADNIAWDSSAFTGAEIQGTDGIILDYLSDSGDIGIQTGGPLRFSGSATHGIRAQSTGGGDVLIDTAGISGFSSNATTHGIQAETNGTGSIVINSTGFISPGRQATVVAGVQAQANGSGDISMTLGSVTAEGVFGTASGNGTGVRAVSNGGDIDVTSNGFRVTGGDLGAYLETSGPGAINFTGPVSIEGSRTGTAGIEARTGSGDITLNLNGFASNSGNNVITSTSGLATINYLVTLSGSGASSSPQFGSSTRNNRHLSVPVIGSSGGGPVVVNMMATSSGGAFVRELPRIEGFVDFSDAGAVDFTIHEGNRWHAIGDSVFSSDSDTVTVAEGAVLHSLFFDINSSPSEALNGIQAPSVLDFGSGDDTLDNQSVIIVGGFHRSFSDTVRRGLEGELRLEGLETFHNAGLIFLGNGADTSTSTPEIFITDGWYDDILSLEGAMFNGTSESRVFMDVNLNVGSGQSGCHAGLRNADGDLPAADCINIRNGSSGGRTSLVLTELFPGDRGAYIPDGIVLVDLSGSGDPSVSSTEHFVIDPLSARYSPKFGGVIDKGIFVFPLVYDETTQQHKLYGVPGQVGLQLPLLAHAAQDLWRHSTASWAERQVNSRDALRRGNELGGGVWIQAKRDNAERDVLQDPVGDGSIVFDNGYEQDSTAINIGVDFFSGQSGDRAWVTGVMLGYVSADLTFDQWPNDANLEGSSAGLYGSYIAGDFFVDATVAGNWLSTAEYDAPALGLFPDSAILTTDATTYGADVEAGWRLKVGMLSVEPLAGLSYVQSRFDDINVPADDPERIGGNVKYDTSTSFRGSLGLRVSVENVLPNVVPTDLTLTTRVIEEFDGDVDIAIENLGPTDAPVRNTFDGTFAQVSGGVKVRNASGSSMGFLNVDGMFESDYESLGVSAGFRYQW